MLTLAWVTASMCYLCHLAWLGFHIGAAIRDWPAYKEKHTEWAEVPLPAGYPYRDFAVSKVPVRVPRFSKLLIRSLADGYPPLRAAKLFVRWAKSDDFCVCKLAFSVAAVFAVGYGLYALLNYALRCRLSSAISAVLVVGYALCFLPKCG